jgi:hypothetical protein
MGLLMVVVVCFGDFLFPVMTISTGNDIYTLTGGPMVISCISTA